VFDKENLIDNVNETIFDYEPVLKEIDKQTADRKNWVKNLLILGVSLIIFFNLGLLRNGLTDLLIVVLVLLIHETGHFVGMRIFRYRNVQMFFIPLFGAAVSGQSHNIPGYKKAIVALLGPLPGIVIGVIFIIVFAVTRAEIYIKLAVMFTIINTFNLLPFFPLDGGRFLNEVLFSRNRYIECCFNLLASAALITGGYFLKAWFLAFIGLFTLVSLVIRFKIGRIAKVLKKKYSTANITAAAGEQTETEIDDMKLIPNEIAREIIDDIRQNFSSVTNVKNIAAYAKNIWEQMHIQPPKIPATMGLLSIYLLSFSLSIVLVTGSIVAQNHAKSLNFKVKIVEYQKPDGQPGKKEQMFFMSMLIHEIEINPDSSLYHGKDMLYYPDGSVGGTGNWIEGRKDGLWKEYDSNGVLIADTLFKKGNFIIRKERQPDGSWIKKELEDLSDFLRQVYKADADGPPRGPVSPLQQSSRIEAKPVIEEQSDL
jgi:Zn-dependent protease/antitoxin component YwqK of YwqJK toxin-antitoxin module